MIGPASIATAALGAQDDARTADRDQDVPSPRCIEVLALRVRLLNRERSRR